MKTIEVSRIGEYTQYLTQPDMAELYSIAKFYQELIGDHEVTSYEGGELYDEALSNLSSAVHSFPGTLG